MRKSGYAIAWLALACCVSVNAAESFPDRATYYAELAEQSTQHLINKTIPTWALVANLLSALTLFLVWRKQQSRDVFTWLMAAVFFSSSHNINSLLGNSLAPWIEDSVFLVWCYCLVRVMIQDLRPPYSGRLLIAALACLLALGISQSYSAQLHSLIWSIIFAILALIAVRQFSFPSNSNARAPSPLLLAVLVIALAGSLERGFALTNLYPSTLVLLMPLAQFLSIILVLYFLVSFYAATRTQLHSLNLSLDHKVQQAECELEHRYQQIKHDAVEAAAIDERSRIYQSIHEDLGDKLLQLIYLAKTPATADLARAALAELRDSRKISIDKQRPLEEILADAHAEIQERCDPLRLKLDWHTDETISLISLNARQESVLNRTLREALSNILKHAKADNVCIKFSCQYHSHWVLNYSISDNGVGIPEHFSSGRGMVNMRQRLQELKGKFELLSGDLGGTTLAFELPVSRPQP